MASETKKGVCLWGTQKAVCTELEGKWLGELIFSTSYKRDGVDGSGQYNLLYDSIRGRSGTRIFRKFT